MTTTLIEDSWQQYQTQVRRSLGEEIDANTLGLMKHAFYFGVFGLSTVMKTVADNADDPEAVDAAITLIQEEAQEFLEDHTAETH